jgi:hypothetical protein
LRSDFPQSQYAIAHSVGVGFETEVLAFDFIEPLLSRSGGRALFGADATGH